MYVLNPLHVSGGHHLKLSEYQAVAGRLSAVLAVEHDDFYASPYEALMWKIDQVIDRGAIILSRDMAL